MGHDLSVRLVCALHGFLGQGADWDQVKDNFNTNSNFDHQATVQWVTPSLFGRGPEYDLSFPEIQIAQGKKIFVGYSLGGRIGLSILEKKPELFDHYVFISVNPGFSTEDKKARDLRWQCDLRWAEQLSEENWNNFLKDWTAQIVFAGTTEEPQRNLKDFDLIKLKKYLLEFSLAKQPDCSDLLRKNKERVTWIVGSRDEKFVAIAAKLEADKIINSYTKIESGHRIPFDSPKKLHQIIETV